MDFNINLHNCAPSWEDVPSEGFIRVGQRSRSCRLDELPLDNLLVFGLGLACQAKGHSNRIPIFQTLQRIYGNNRGKVRTTACKAYQCASKKGRGRKIYFQLNMTVGFKTKAMAWADPEGGGPGVRTPPGILAKMCLSDSWNGTDLILHSIYVKYSHKFKKKKKVLNVETSSWLELETLTFLVKGLHPLKSGNQSII